MSKTVRAKPFKEITPLEEKQRHEWRRRKRQIEQEIEDSLWEEQQEKERGVYPSHADE